MLPSYYWNECSRTKLFFVCIYIRLWFIKILLFVTDVQYIGRHFLCMNNIKMKINVPLGNIPSCWFLISSIIYIYLASIYYYYFFFRINKTSLGIAKNKKSIQWFNLLNEKYKTKKELSRRMIEKSCGIWTLYWELMWFYWEKKYNIIHYIIFSKYWINSDEFHVFFFL